MQIYKLIYTTIIYSVDLFKFKNNIFNLKIINLIKSEIEYLIQLDFKHK